MSDIHVAYTRQEAKVVRRALALYREAMSKTMIDLLDPEDPQEMRDRYGRRVSTVYEAEHKTEEALIVDSLNPERTS